MKTENGRADLSLVIFTCKKFSDLWDSNIKLLNQNWSERNIDTYLVTDEPTERAYDGIQILAAGSGSEMSQKMELVLNTIQTDYLLVTLDDYFFVDKIDDALISRCLSIAEKEDIDYFRLYTFMNAKYFTEHYADYDDIYRITTDARYNINLYPAIFSKKFLLSTTKEVRNAWQYEVSLTRHGERFGANCVLIKPNAINMLDVVRKGKLLRDAARYLKRNGLYDGPRETMALIPYLKINAIYLLKRTLPRKLVNQIRSFLKKCGMHFYSDEYEQ